MVFRIRSTAFVRPVQVNSACFWGPISARARPPLALGWRGVDRRQPAPIEGVARAGPHSFLVLTGTAEFVYKTTDYYAPPYECCIAWDDPVTSIGWHSTQHSIVFPQLPAKHLQGVSRNNALVYPL